jgi:hypothetical protein
MSKKRILAGMLAITLVFGTAASSGTVVSEFVGDLGISASADDNEHTSGLWRYIIQDDGTAYISSYSGFDTNLTIPSKLDGITISGIARDAFANSKNIGNVVLSSNIKYIGASAFENSSIKTLKMSTSSKLTFGLYWDDSCAFKNCTSLKSVNINADTVPPYTFEGCTSLSSVTLSSNVKTLDRAAFSGTTALKTVNGSEYVTYIGRDCFVDSGLTSFKMSSKLSYIGAYAFKNTKLTSVTIPASVTEWGTYWDDSSAFADCSKLKKAVISTETVPVAAFENCTALTSVTTGVKTKIIDEYAFKSCSKLSTFTVKSNLESIGRSSFENCSKLSSFNLGSKLTYIGTSAFNGTALTTIAIPSSVVQWGTYWGSSDAFSNCTKLKNVYIGNTSLTNGSETIDDIFANSTNVKIICTKGSAAYTYAKNKGISISTMKSIPSTAISLNKTAYTVKVGESLTLNPNISPITTTDTITWISGNEDIAEISASGVITGKEAGVAAIQGTTSSGKTCTATITVVNSGTTSTDPAKTRSIKSCYIGTIGSKLYTGNPVKPSIDVYLNFCTKLVKDVDYTVSYSNNINTGIATVKVTGKGTYTGTITKTFKIIPGQVKTKKTYTSSTNAVRINWSKVAGAKGYIVERYNATSKKWVRVKKITNAKTVTYKDTKLKSGTAYKYRVKAYGGSGVTGKYSATVSTATTPAQVTIKSKSRTKNTVRLTWKKVTCDGYKIQKYNTKTKKWVNVKKVSSDTITTRITGLNKNTAYKFRIVAYKKGGSKYLYSTASKTVSVRTLKK